MKRSNLFALAPTREQHHILKELGVNCAKLWNEVNYLHRQQYENYLKLDWNPQIYKKYVPLVGSATAQQIVRKNNEVWRSFLALKRLERRGKLPPTMKQVRMPGYWKRDGRYLLRPLFRCDSYRIVDGCLHLHRNHLHVAFKGQLRWTGKQGRLEIAWDSLSKKWRVFQCVDVKPIITPLGSKACYIDMGVRNLATIWMSEWRQPIAYQSGRVLADWWYWTNRIARYQERLAAANGRKKSKQLSRLYGVRKRRFRHAVATFLRQLLTDLYAQGISTIVIGELTGIRMNGNRSRQNNSMVHNFWSHKYVADRLRWTAEEYGIKVRTISEAHTSRICPRCRSRHSLRVSRSFRCLDCGLQAHRDAVGVLNMAARCGEYAVRPMVWPMLLRWDGCGWNRNNGMPTPQRIGVEA